MPSAFVATQHSWNSTVSESESEVQRRLRIADPAFPRQSITFLLIDEGQDTYSDPIFWNSFIKEVGDGIYPYYRVILFCSYGSPSSHPVDYDIGSPPVLRATARISLWPVEGKSPGILLQWSEFVEVVSLSERPLNVHPDLLNLIFDWTVGHVGAVIELLRLISYLVSLSCQPQLLGSLISAPQKVSQTRHGEPFTVQDFHDENPVHLLVQRLDAGAFERGLPREFSPDLVALFRTLLKDRKFERKEGEAEDGAVLMCHRRGWIHATVIPGGVRYTLPSPLHEVCLSWKLEPTNDIPNFASLFELSLEVISKFKPSQLQLPLRRVGSASTDPPEAQYQDEFYHALLATTFGNVRISPEYASAQGARVAGRIDFFIPIVKWGIEITRDGSRIPEQGARFADSGAYGAWLKSADMNDYILLDFRTKNPRGQHPSMIFFSDQCSP